MNLNLYELSLVIDSQLEEKAISELRARYIALLEENGATIINIDHRGIRKLAYDIQGKDRAWRNQADYTFIQFEAPPTVVVPVEELLRLDEDVLRYMTIRPRHTPMAMPSPEEQQARDRRPRGDDDDDDDGRRGPRRHRSDEDDDEG
jgi:small subunit ribosomal protein S6